MHSFSRAGPARTRTAAHTAASSTPDHAAQQCADKFQKLPHFRLPPFMPTVT